jgi:hypothetical protein
VQFTPPYSQCSISFGKGLTAAEPGSADRVLLAVEDIDSARDDLIRRGVDAARCTSSGPRGFESIEGRSYFAYASFSGPDGNGWLLQEVTTRLPGREWGTDIDVASLRAVNTPNPTVFSEGRSS